MSCASANGTSVKVSGVKEDHSSNANSIASLMSASDKSGVKFSKA
jgi:hypothetical protein